MDRNARLVQIYETLLSLLDEKPTIDKISVADIANKLDIGKSTLYEYFATKEQLVFETLSYISEIFLNNLAQIPLVDFEESCLCFMTTYYNFQKKAKKFCLSFNTNILFEDGDYKNKYLDEVTRIRETAVNVANTIFQLGFNEGKINLYPFDAFGLTFIETTIIQMISVFDIKSDFLKMDWPTYSKMLYQSLLSMLK